MIDLPAGLNEMQLLGSAAAAMTTQRALLDVAARNVAAAQAATPDHAYSKLVATFANPPAADDRSDPDFADESELAGDAETAGGDGSSALVGVRAEPGSGDALTEMIAVLDAQRAYEQNASIFDTAKRLAERTIDIGRS